MKAYQHILIIQTAYLGDVILITPLIRATRRLFPSARLDVMVIPETAGVLGNNPNIDSLIRFDKRGARWRSFFRTVKTLRRGRYDLAITPHSSLTTALLMKWGRIPERLGYDRWSAARTLTLRVPHLQNVLKIERNLHLLSLFSKERFDMQTELFPDEAMRERTASLLSALLRSVKRVIAVAPGSIWPTKRWPEASYVSLMRALDGLGYGLVFIGAPEEKALCDRIIGASDADALNLAGRLGPLESAAVIERCDLMICNDSGAMHIANAMKTDVFVFFGPTVKSLGHFPFRENDVVFETSLACRPCGSHGGKKCPEGHHLCMRKIKPEHVVEKVEAKFNAYD